MRRLRQLQLRRIGAVFSALVLAACASPPDRGSGAISEAISAQYQLKHAVWQSPNAPAISDTELAQPLSLERALSLALQHNPRMQMLYAELGIAQAELMDASRISNPSFDWNRSKPTKGNLPAKLSFGISQSITDLLMLGARRNLAGGILQRSSSEISAQVSTLIFDTESAYWHAVSAEQVRAMRRLVADSAEASSIMAERFFSAGNINKAQLANENAAAAEALVALKQVEAEVIDARGHLNQILGLAAGDVRVNFESALPAIPSQVDSAEVLQALAFKQRRDLAAVRTDVALLTAMLRTTKRWRWLGEFDLAVERERETDGEKLRGIGFSLGLPIFNQGQGSVLRAQSLLEMATAKQAQLEVQVQSDVFISAQKLEKHSEIVGNYAKVLVPAREAVVAENQQRYNFMLIGAFELLQAKNAEYDAYQGYLEAMRDYWVARSALKLAVGGELPSSSVIEPAAQIGLPTAPKSATGGKAMDHSLMQKKADSLETIAAPSGAVYVCPMHEEVTGDKPGVCPICGMDLQLKQSAKSEHLEHDHNGDHQ